MLIELLNNPEIDPLYARGVMTALVRMKDVHAIPSIVRLLDSEDRHVKEWAVRSLEALTKQADLAPASTRPPDLTPEDSENSAALSTSAENWRTWWETAGQKAFEELVSN